MYLLRRLATDGSRAGFGSLIPGALADRFGLSIGFHNCSQDDYLAIIGGYCAEYGLNWEESAALEWSKRRGARSGRVAWQFVTELAGQAGKAL